MLGYARKVLAATTRDPFSGWLTFVAGAALTLWIAVFILLSTGAVFQSWGADGDVKAEYVALSGAWLTGVGLLVAILWNARRTARYLSESYRAGEWPLPARLLRWLFRL
ncbi:hypothetical protein [Terrabacter sp. RAF57]|uniref:hypothetical protein n=1 Tax=Terrabacter sp. RAF57 TaxID=3233063 RepID=UPI003F9B608E